MFYFYVLYSLKDFKLYKGYSTDPGKRFLRHQAGAVASTKHRRPLILIYLESFQTKTEALHRERWAKSADGGPRLLNILIDKGILNKNRKLLNTGL